jgi:hypothetical protein
MSGFACRALWSFCCLTAILWAGCGSPDFGAVDGRVTLDGQPLAGATVEFQPDGGSPAYGVTDDDGRYTLRWSVDQGGAPVGPVRVRITSFQESQPNVKERVPARYNKKTDLVREVKPGGQTLDFELESK